jgi:NAD(P)-dependent dehydrogenase (short-subunit alcohol dehydrogenase family)
MSKQGWSADSIPDQNGKTAIVTGGSAGLGKETARVLASKGARLIVAVRDLNKGEQALADIRQSVPNAKLSLERLDLASLASTKTFADKILASESRLDLLINNAGVMFPPYTKTADGFELQFGTNHLGHFALTAHLLPLLLATPDARIVNVSSLAHSGGKLDFADLNWERRKYNRTQGYCDSKIANLYFTYELARRLRDKPLRVIAAHPGMTRTELTRHSGAMMNLMRPMFQDVSMGALPTLRAACDPGAQSAEYYGPSGFIEGTGPPVKVTSNARSHDAVVGQRLWAVSEQMTGVAYPV